MTAHRPYRLAAAVSLVTLVVAAGAVSAPRSELVDEARVVSSVPTTIRGTTDDAELVEGAPVPSCTTADGVVWYSVTAPRRTAMVARLRAAGTLDAAVAVYRVVRNQVTEVACDETDRHGRAAASWRAYTEGTYLVGVVRRAESPSGSYELTLAVAERAPRPPGVPLPVDGVRATIAPVLDSADAWAVSMDRGTSYRMNLTTPGTCLSLSIYRPDTESFALAAPVRTYPCGGYAVFTPGIDGGGRYSLVVRARGGDPVRQMYRLQVAAAGADDGAPGVTLENGETVAGSLFGRGVDNLDLYRFLVPRENELTKVELRTRATVGFSLFVLDETGGRAASGRGARGLQVVREHLPAGRYFLGVESRDRSGGRYDLGLLVRDVTTTTVAAAGQQFAEAPPATPIPLSVRVTSASHGGPVIITIDHYDPIYGWHFATTVAARVEPDGVLDTSWTPPSVGHWRARARFTGTLFSSFSQSDYVLIHVAEPLEISGAVPAP